ncbi:hypothetical protein [Clostridium sp.]|jgi:hypothetical protein|uniref:hypothetical protein n=1 Tax=Clostridium sp. TaxID=1506 RepID=UPI002584B313|nr:hypothetical protein [Clostridium sp.]MDF2503408.1 hypothetical protein [Clostridium sp.]
MKGYRTKVIVVFFVITVILIIWSDKVSTNNRLLGYYNADLEKFNSNYVELINSFDNFVDSPDVESHGDVEYMIGTTISSLGSLDSSMVVCYRMGLLQNDKLRYEESEVIVFAARIIKESRKLLNESIELKDNKIILNESKIKLVYENLDEINELFEPYYSNVK